MMKRLSVSIDPKFHLRDGRGVTDRDVQNDLGDFQTRLAKSDVGHRVALLLGGHDALAVVSSMIVARFRT